MHGTCAVHIAFIPYWSGGIVEVNGAKTRTNVISLSVNRVLACVLNHTGIEAP